MEPSARDHAGGNPRLEIHLPAERDAGSATSAVIVLPGGGYMPRRAASFLRAGSGRLPGGTADALVGGRTLLRPGKRRVDGFQRRRPPRGDRGTQPTLHRDPHDDLSISARPDRLVLCYGVLSLPGQLGCHGSARNFLGGEEHFTDENRRRFDSPAHVTADTPPTFLFHTVADGSVPVRQSLNFAAACADHGVPLALHVYTHGRHGIGFALDDPTLRGWPELLAAWLKGPV